MITFKNTDRENKKWEKYSFKTSIDIFGHTLKVVFHNTVKYDKLFNKNGEDDTSGLQRPYHNDIIVMLESAYDSSGTKWQYYYLGIRKILTHEVGHFISQNGFYSGMKYNELLAELVSIGDSYRFKIDKVMKDLKEDIKRFDKGER